MPSLTAKQIAAQVDGELVGDETAVVSGVAGLGEAGPRELSFLANPKYAGQVAASRAAIVLVPTDFAGESAAGCCWVKCDNPSAAFSRIIDVFLPPPPRPVPGISPQAVVAAGVELGTGVHVGACAVIEADAVIGDNTIIGAGVYVGTEARIGDDCWIYPNVSIRERVQIGHRVIIHCGAVIGSDGFGFEPDPTGGPHLKLPQRGIVQIDDDVEIGAGTTVDRARFGRTWIQRNVKIDNLVQVAHNVVVGEGSFLMAQVGIAGSARLGRLCALFGQSGVPGHLEVGDRAKLMAKTAPFGDVEPGAELVGFPGRDRRDFMRETAALRKLPDLLKRVRRLERRLAELEREEDD